MSVALWVFNCLQNMWPEESSVNTVNLAKKISPEISNFSYGITFYLYALYLY